MQHQRKVIFVTDHRLNVKPAANATDKKAHTGLLAELATLSHPPANSPTRFVKDIKQAALSKRAGIRARGR